MQNHPSIYDKTLKEYKVVAKKEALWQAKADLMSLTKKALQQWFKMQRTLYSKLTEDGFSGEGEKQRSECQEWTLEELCFMGTHITWQPKTRQPASINLKLAQTKASAMVRQKNVDVFF